MAATQTVGQIPQSCNLSRTTAPLTPQNGVLTLFGYGIRVFVDRGHLAVEDGIGATRRSTRFARVRHGLQRLVVIGSDGMVSLAALRWLADQDAAFVMLDRDGSVLATTGPVRSSDARLRRAQALANESGVALTISCELISQKLAAQARVAREMLLDDSTADAISQFREALDSAETIDRVRLLEAKAAAAYWALWRNLPISYPRKDMPRVPQHWLSFGTRVSPISGSQRLAVNPPNAILNYLYAILESEARLAVAALGLDPGLGFLHMDAPARDSLIFDLIEPIRPVVDAYLVGWITREPLQRSWFFEKPDGNCRLMASLTEKLSETAPTWARAVAPYAEWVAQTLWTRRPGSNHEHRLATRLTQRHKREAKDQPSVPQARSIPRPEKLCRGCGAKINPGTEYCSQCSIELAKGQFAIAAKFGRVIAQGAEAQTRRSATQVRQMAGRQGWVASQHPVWLDNETYVRKIQPLLAGLTCSAVASAIGVSMPYAADIRAGKRCPHPRHWQALAQLVGISPDA